MRKKLIDALKNSSAESAWLMGISNLRPAEVSGSLLSLCGVKISFGVLISVITSGGEKRSCLLAVTMFFYSACGVGKLKVFRAAELVLS